MKKFKKEKLEKTVKEYKKQLEDLKYRKAFEEEKNKKRWLSQETKNSILAIILFAIAILSALSFFNQSGTVGQYFYKGLLYILGIVAFLFPLVLVLSGISFLKGMKKERWRNVILGSFLFIISLLGVAVLIIPKSQIEYPGGMFGFVITWPILRFFNNLTGVLIFGALLIISILAIFDVPLKKIGFIRKILNKRKANLIKKEKQEESRLDSKLEIGSNVVRSSKNAHMHFDKNYEPPSLDLLDISTDKPNSGNIEENKKIIENTLYDFGIKVEMDDVQVGPTVSQYTFKPDQGVKLSRITELSRNLSLALAAHPIRIEAPIPGKALVGVEIPNKLAVNVRLRDVIESIQKDSPKSSLVLPLGRDISGKVFYDYLDKMPHLLVAGSTGSGKSVAMNSFIGSLTYFNSPKMLRFILIDPKRVEFSIYEGIPHLLTQVVVNVKKAISALKWLTNEMDNRYEILEQAKVRDIKSYNKEISKKQENMPMPYLIVMIDEMADLMVQYKREVESVVVRLAQMSRAVGIHLIAATQRPSTDVVTGLIKANIPARISFKVASQIDSRTILDMAGSEKLLGQGDMLYMSSNAPGVKRIQGTFVTDSETKKIVRYLKELNEKNNYEEINSTIQHTKPNIPLIDYDFESEDELYNDAKQIVLQAGKGSSSLLQRKLQIGYARAARLIDMLEKEGIVGSAHGSKPREVIKE